MPTRQGRPDNRIWNWYASAKYQKPLPGECGLYRAASAFFDNRVQSTDYTDYTERRNVNRISASRAGPCAGLPPPARCQRPWQSARPVFTERRYAMNDTNQIDLTKFVKTGLLAGRLDEPFTQGGFIYATDGYMAVRLPATEAIDTEGRRLPTMLDLGWAPSPGASLLTAGSDEAISTEPCKACTGTGRVVERTCPNCLEDLYSDCPLCDGTGRPGPQYIRVRDGEHGFLRAFDWNRICGLPNAILAVPQEDEPESIYFTFDDGGEGLVMPTTNDSAKKKSQQPA